MYFHLVLLLMKNILPGALNTKNTKARIYQQDHTETENQKEADNHKTLCNHCYALTVTNSGGTVQLANNKVGSVTLRQFKQIHVAIYKNTIYNLDRYSLQFEQIQFVI